MEMSRSKFFNEDKSGWTELLKYQKIFSDLIYWENRKYYLQILNHFIFNDINCREFVIQFYGLGSDNMRALKIRETNLEGELNLKYNHKSSRFIIKTDIFKLKIQISGIWIRKTYGHT